MTVYVQLDGDLVKDVAFQGKGCAVSKASASIMTQILKGKTRAEAEELFTVFHDLLTGKLDADAEEERLGKLIAFKDVSKFPVRVKCAPWPGTRCTPPCMTRARPYRRSKAMDERTSQRMTLPRSDEKPAPLAQSAPAVDPNASLEERVVAALHSVYDPEIPVDIYELGLIYDLKVDPSGAVFRSDPTLERQFEVVEADQFENGWVPIGRDALLEQSILEQLARFDPACDKPTH